MLGKQWRAVGHAVIVHVGRRAAAEEKTGVLTQCCTGLGRAWVLRTSEHHNETLNFMEGSS